ncbi:MAG: triose-phosphate isomerase [Myxococcales bacterium]|nr:triose-phosphate isomerase [Myxococcales bacterium]
MRTPILVANWKMHKGVREATAFAEDLKLRLQAPDGVEVVIAPPFTALGALQRALQGSGIELAGQNLYPEAEGAFTGEISPAFLRDVGCRYVILGHSERRHGFGESSEFVARKVRAACDHELRPIVCVGETLEEHEAGRTAEVIEAQIRGSLAQVPPEASETLVLAYEPVWAIGTGRTASPGDAQKVHAMIRELLRERFGAAADRIRIQYGGSVKPENGYALMAQPDIDGALVGGASLDPASFFAIIRFERASGEAST